MRNICLLLLVSTAIIGSFTAYSDAHALPSDPSTKEKIVKERINKAESDIEGKKKKAAERLNAETDKVKKRVLISTEEASNIIVALKNICNDQENFDAVKSIFRGKNLISTWTRIVDRISDTHKKRVAIKDFVKSDTIKHTECWYDSAKNAYVETSYTLDLKKAQPQCVRKSPTTCDPHDAGLL